MPRTTDRRALLRAALLAGGMVMLGRPVAARAGGAGPIAPNRVDWTAAPVRLLMVEAKGCIYCAAWRREIGPGYPASSEGRAAPLLVVDRDGPWPDGIALERRPTITPTFVLLRDGMELSRLEGYPGDQFFYPLIAGMLAREGMDASEREIGG